MKTLIIVIHPNLNVSIVNKRWMEAAANYPANYTIHDLYQAYPDQKIDVLAEQRLVENHEKIIFQFPFYWFSSPPLLKQWLDEVLTYGWTYGSTSGYKLKGKKISMAISAGIDEKEYSLDGKYGDTLETLTLPFKLTFEYVKAEFSQIFTSYGFEKNAKKNQVDISVSKYLDFLDGF